MEFCQNPFSFGGNVSFFFVACRAPLKPFVQNNVHVIPKRDFIESIRRDVSKCIAISNGVRIKNWENGLLWKVPFLLFSRPWRRKQLTSSEPDSRLSGDEVDIWFTFGCSANSANMIESAIKRNRPAMLFVGSNADIVAPRQTNARGLDQYGERFSDRALAIQKATKVICQTEWQFYKLRELHGIEGTLLRNPIDLQAWRPIRNIERKGVLWIGRYDDFHKRVDLAIEVARRCPDVQFKLIVNPGDAQIENRVRSENLPNVFLVDYVPSDKIMQEFTSAAAFLSTGNPEYEGFPNVMLQAAATETPIISLYDFDNFLENAKAGFVCNGSIELAIDNIRKALSSKDLINWPHVANYLENHHSWTTARQALVKLIDDYKPETRSDSKESLIPNC